MSEQPSTPITASEIRTALAAARADVLAALEQGKALPLSEVAELRGTIDEAISGYTQLLESTPAEGRGELERTLGRQVIDLRRTAALLPQTMSGTAAQHSPDRVPGGGQPFIETRAPPRSMGTAASGRPSQAKAFRTGGEVEAWCGPCGGLRTHNIIALVGDQPKQVICQSCNARHGFRLTPARSQAGEDRPRSTAGSNKMRKTPERIQEERKQEELRRLKDELAAAPDVQLFDPRRRYKGGQVINHPEYGRGKIENVLKASILVRFTGGLRSLMTK